MSRRSTVAARFKIDNEAEYLEATNGHGVVL